MDRTTLIKEPGFIVRNGQTFYSKGPITVDFVEEYATKAAQPFGVVDKFPVDRRVEIKFTPAGEWESLSHLFWAPSMALGTDLFGGADVATVIYGRVSGRKITVHNTAFTTQPTIAARLKDSLIGECMITGLLANNTAPTGAAAYFTEAVEASMPDDSNFSAAAILSQAYGGAWGGDSPWDDFDTENGFTIASSLKLNPKYVDGLGTVGMILAEHQVSAKCTPVGITRAQALAALQFGTALGTVKTANALNITGTGFYVRLYNAKFRAPATMRFDLENYFTGEVTFDATLSITAGTADPLLYCGTSAPA